MEKELNLEERLSALNARSAHRTPPGLPLRYVLKVVCTTCAGCGSRSESSTLSAIWRKGASGAAEYGLPANAKLHNLPVDLKRVSHATPACSRCFDRLPREPVPELPPAKRVLKPQWARVGELPDLGIDLGELGLL